MRAGVKQKRCIYKIVVPTGILSVMTKSNKRLAEVAGCSVNTKSLVNVSPEPCRMERGNNSLVVFIQREINTKLDILFLSLAEWKRQTIARTFSYNVK